MKNIEFIANNKKFNIDIGSNLLNFINYDSISISKKIYLNVIKNLNSEGRLESCKYKEVLDILIKTHSFYETIKEGEYKEIIFDVCVYFLKKRSEILYIKKNKLNSSYNNLIEQDYFNIEDKAFVFGAKEINDYLRCIFDNIPDEEFKTIELTGEVVSQRDIHAINGEAREWQFKKTLVNQGFKTNNNSENLQFMDEGLIENKISIINRHIKALIYAKALINNVLLYNKGQPKTDKIALFGFLNYLNPYINSYGNYLDKNIKDNSMLIDIQALDDMIGETNLIEDCINDIGKISLAISEYKIRAAVSKYFDEPLYNIENITQAIKFESFYIIKKEIIIKKCEYCKVLFLSDRKNKKYCSSKEREYAAQDAYNNKTDTFEKIFILYRKRINTRKSRAKNDDTEKCNNILSELNEVKKIIEQFYKENGGNCNIIYKRRLDSNKVAFIDEFGKNTETYTKESIAKYKSDLDNNYEFLISLKERLNNYAKEKKHF